jgi:hypothetical protein
MRAKWGKMTDAESPETPKWKDRLGRVLEVGNTINFSSCFFHRKMKGEIRQLKCEEMKPSVEGVGWDLSRPRNETFLGSN